MDESIEIKTLVAAGIHEAITLISSENELGAFKDCLSLLIKSPIRQVWGTVI